MTYFQGWKPSYLALGCRFQLWCGKKQMSGASFGFSFAKDRHRFLGFSFGLSFSLERYFTLNTNCVSALLGVFALSRYDV